MQYFFVETNNQPNLKSVGHVENHSLHQVDGLCFQGSATCFGAYSCFLFGAH